MQLSRFLGLFLAAALATGCATTGSKKTGAKPKPSIQIVEQPGAANLTPEMRAVFLEMLNDELFGKGGEFSRGNEVTLEWQATHVDRGSRALRYLVGMGAGAGSFQVRARLIDAKGQVLATTDVEGTQVMGIGGGSYDSAIEEAALDVADFTTDAF